MKRIYQYLLRNTAQAGSPYTLTLIYLSGFAPSQTLSQWNTQLGGNYTNLSVVGDNIILTGGSNVAFPNAALQGEAQLLEIQDDGSVISCGNLCFDSSGLQNVSLSAVTTIGPNCFSNCLSLAQISLPACTDLGGTSGDDNVFSGITNNTIAAVFNTILSTNNSGQPDGDILDLYANNDVATQWDTAPVNTVAPAITGTNSVGSVLTCSQGTWTYLGDITYAYQWRRGGSPIGGATASTYTLVQADAAATIDCVVTATTSAGSTPATSSNSLYIYDTDANAFISAASITNNTQKAAVNKLVADLKGYSIWTKMKAIYPIVGGTASSHAVNLKTPGTYNMTFASGMTHSSTGMISNGTSGYGNCNLDPSSVLTLNNTHISFYSRTSTIASTIIGDMSVAIAGAPPAIGLGTNTGVEFSDHYNFPTGRISSSIASATGMYIGTRTTSTNHKLYKNGIQLGVSTLTNTLSLPNANIYVCGANLTTTTSYSNKQCAFASIGDGLSDTEAANFYTAVQAYQTTLGRNV